MKHLATKRFWRCYHGLPATIQKLAHQSFAHLKTESAHPSLHFKKVGQFWSARVGLHYRALAREVDSDVAWFWIGTDAEYDKLLGRRPTTRRPRPTAAQKPAKKRPPLRRG